MEHVGVRLEKLIVAEWAEFDACGTDYHTCLPNTRKGVLRRIHAWARAYDSKPILWLNGASGTGKSTIARTIAESLQMYNAEPGCIPQHPRFYDARLGASFFFKRGEADRGSAACFFPTIAKQLAKVIPELGIFVPNVVGTEPRFCERLLGEQFERLICNHLSAMPLDALPRPPLIVIVDALDECAKDEDIDSILELWLRLSEVTAGSLKLFVTSRPELHVDVRLSKVSGYMCQDMRLHDIPERNVQKDISMYLHSAFSQIRSKFNSSVSVESRLERDWPGEDIIQNMVCDAGPLFIVAATMQRFVSDHKCHPKQQLAKILNFRNDKGLTILEHMYLLILEQLSECSAESLEKLRVIIGSIITLARPLSTRSLAEFLKMSVENLKLYLEPLHSVLQVPEDSRFPIGTLHSSFAEFLISSEFQEKSFGIDGVMAHKVLMERCLSVLSDNLHEDMCKLGHPGQCQKDIASTTIQRHLAPFIQYACQYWVHHAKESQTQLRDNGIVHNFLRKHFLHWLEALSLLGRITVAITCIDDLQLMASSIAGDKIEIEEYTQPNTEDGLIAFLTDARRFIRRNWYVCDVAPLQVYSSAIIFSPQNNQVRKAHGQIPHWITRCPRFTTSWGDELQTLKGHTSRIGGFALSDDGLLASFASNDTTGTVRLWDIQTGQEVLKQVINEGYVRSVAFISHDLLLLELVDSWDIVLNFRTGVAKYDKLSKRKEFLLAVSPTGQLVSSNGREICIRDPRRIHCAQDFTISSHEDDIIAAIAISHDGILALAYSHRRPLRLWDLEIHQEVSTPEDPVIKADALAFSSDGVLAAACENGTICLIWPRTAQKAKVLVRCASPAHSVVFSETGLLAFARSDLSVQVWDIRIGQHRKTFRSCNVVRCMIFLSDNLLATHEGGFHIIRVWDVGASSEGQKASMKSILPDTKAALDPADLFRHHSPVNCCKFSPDGSVLASGHNDGTLSLWDTESGQELVSFEEHSGPVGPLIFSRDGSHLASVSHNAFIQMWEMETKQPLATLEGHTLEVLEVAFSPDGKLLASSSFDHTVRVWDLGVYGTRWIGEGHTDDTNCVVFSPDGTSLASTSRDGTVRIWEVDTGQTHRVLEGHEDNVEAAIFSPDGSRLASVSEDETVRLWDVETGQELWFYPGFFRNVAFSPDGSLLASDLGWSEALLFSVDTGEMLKRYKVDRAESLGFTDDGQALVTDKGTIPLDRLMTSSLNSAPSVGSITLDHKWVRWDGKNILWLPLEYRTYKQAVYGNKIALQNNLNQFCFMEFDCS